MTLRLAKENEHLESKVTELEIAKMRMMKYKEVIKHARLVRCQECNKEYKPSVFRAHLKVKCRAEKEN